MQNLIALGIALAFVSGCKSTPDDGYALDINLTFDSSVSDADVSRATTLRVEVSGAEQLVKDVDVTGKFQARTAGLRYKPEAQSGTISFAFTALAGTEKIAEGQLPSVALIAGKTQVLEVTLSSASTIDAGMDALDGGSDGSATGDMAACGNGVVDPGEQCDPGAGSSKPCPTSSAECDDQNDCTTDTLTGAGCQAACMHMAIANNSGCGAGTGVCLNGACCAGCIANGACLPGTSDAKNCGKGGAACFDCTKNSASATCNSGSCSGCDATSCTNEGRTCGTSSCGYNCGGCQDSCVNGTLTHYGCSGTSCQPNGTPMSCTPYAVCASVTACATTCTGNSDCANGYYCDATKHCVAKQANGSNCGGDSSQCTSGHCVDGVCCDSDCTDQCAACNLMGKIGTCSPVTGAPVGSRTPCAGTGTTCGGTCDGTVTTSCSYPPSTMSCGAVTCSGDLISQNYCDGMGGCVSKVLKNCGNYICAYNSTDLRYECATTCNLSTGYGCYPPATCKNNVPSPSCS